MLKGHFSDKKRDFSPNMKTICIRGKVVSLISFISLFTKNGNSTRLSATNEHWRLEPPKRSLYNPIQREKTSCTLTSDGGSLIRLQYVVSSPADQSPSASQDTEASPFSRYVEGHPTVHVVWKTEAPFGQVNQGCRHTVPFASPVNFKRAEISNADFVGII